MSMDLLPTLLSMADPGLALPSGLDGQNILPVLRGEKPEHDFMYWSFGQSRAVRRGDWKLILNPPNFPGEEVKAPVWLSNLEADPAEVNNLVDSQRDRVVELTARLRAWEREVGLLQE